jgi:hypothetical protein
MLARVTRAYCVRTPALTSVGGDVDLGIGVGVGSLEAFEDLEGRHYDSS